MDPWVTALIILCIAIAIGLGAYNYLPSTFIDWIKQAVSNLLNGAPVSVSYYSAHLTVLLG